MIRQRIRIFLRRFDRDTRGVSAVEFALLAPLMIIIYFGMSTYCMAFMANKRMTHTNAAVADMVAQAAAVDTTLLDDLLTVGGLLMRPFPATQLGVRVTSVTRADGQDTVDWSRGNNFEARNEGDVYEGIPAGLIVDGESLIVSESTYDYQSPVDMFLPGITQFESVHFVRPRLVNTTTCSDC